MILLANFNSLASLKSGGLSLVFHAPFDQANQAMRLHAHQGQQVRMEIFVENE